MVIYPHVKSNRLRGIAVTSAKRSNAMPEIPAFNETVPGYETYAWQAFLGPKALPKELVMRWNTEINRVLQLPEIKARMAADGVEPARRRAGTLFRAAQARPREVAESRRAREHQGGDLTLQPKGETAMPFYEKGDVRIHYEEAGSGFPLLIIPGGGLELDDRLLRRQRAVQPDGGVQGRVPLHHGRICATPTAASPPARSRSTGPGTRTPTTSSA